VTGPLGPERLDYLFAMLQALTANVNRSKGQRPFKLDEFMPKWGRARQAGPMTPEDMLRAVKRANKAMGGEVRGGDDSRPPR
jgi:hypothetical protein